VAALIAAILAIPAMAAPQDITTLLAIFLRNLHAGRIVIPQQTAFASLPTIQDGVVIYCSDCLEGSDPASGSSSGAFVLRVNGRWVALDGGSGTGGNLTAEYWIGAADGTLVNAKNLGALSTALVVNTSGVPSAYAGVSCTNQFIRALSAVGAVTCATVSLTADVTGNLPVTNLDSGTNASGTTFWRGDGAWATPASGAPTDAEYWVGAANGTLSAEKNLGALSTALVLNTAGVPSAYGGIDCTNQFPRDVSASGVGTCASVSLANDITGTLAIGSGGTGQTAKTAAFDALSPVTTRGDIITRDASNNVRLAIGPSYYGPVSDGTDLSYRAITFMGGFVAAGGFTTSSTAYVDVTGVTVAFPPAFLFAFDCYGTFTTSDNASGTTNGLGLSVNGTGGTGQAAVYTIWMQTTADNTAGNNTTSTTPFAIRNESAFNSMTALASVVSVATSLKWMMKGFYYSGTSGTSTFALRVRSENGSPQSASVQVGSYCLFTKQG
jgi:hypothetical protein